MAMILRPPGLRRSLAERLQSLAHWQRFWSLASGLLWLAAFLSAGLAIELGCDFAFVLPPLPRALALASLLAGGVAIAAFAIIKPWRRRATSLNLAIALEAKHPELNDALASAVAFLAAPPSANGFRDAAVSYAEKTSEPLNWNRVLPMRRFWLAFWLAVIAGASFAIVAASHAPRLPMAFARLADPWGNHPWPSRTKIAIAPFPARLALGDPWPLAFTLRGDLPAEARIEFQNANSRFEETVAITADGDDAEKASAALSLDPSRCAVDFQFRILAGDGETAWQSVSVAPPPRLIGFDGRPSPRIRLSYPDYTGWAALDLPDGSGSVETVAGTRIDLMAKTDRPIAQAVLRFQGDAQAVMPLQAIAPLAAMNPFAAAAINDLAEGFTADIPVAISGADRRSLSVSFVPPQSGLYALRFTDDTGLTGQRLLDLRTFADPTPTVTLLRPDASKDTLDLLADGSVTVEARADDRTFAVRTLGLEYRVGDEPWQTLPLVDLAVTAQILPALVGGSIPLAASHPPSLALREVLLLSRFRRGDGRAPAAGDVITLRAISQDWDDVSILKAPGRSSEVILRVHSPQSLDAELQRQLVGLREPLKKTLDAQTEAASAARKANADAATFPEAERAQAAVRNRLADPAEGLRARLDRLQQTQRENRLPATGTTARLDAVAKALARVDEKQLPGIDAALAEAKKNPAAFDDLARKQQAAAEELAAAAKELDRWAGLAEVQSDARALAQQMRQAGEAAERLNAELPPGVAAEKLPPQQRAALDRAAREHSAAAEGLNRLLGKAEKVREAKSATQKDEADKLEKALKNAGGSATEAELQKAAEDLRNNRLADANASRADAESRLKAFEDSLAGRDAAPTADELKKKAKQRAKQVDDIQKEEDELAKKMKASKDGTPAERAALAEEQERLRRKSEKLAEELKADHAAEAAEKLERATEKMDKAAEELVANGDAAKTAEEAAQELARAQEKLPKPETAPQDLVREQQEELLKTLKSFRDRQQAAVEESLRLTAAAAKAHRWERPLIASLVAMAASEDSLATELRNWSAKSLADAPVFAKLAGQAAERMEQAAARLRERKDDALTTADFVADSEAAADETARRPLREAQRRLEQIIDALAEKPKETAAAKPMGDAAPREPAPAGGQQKPPPLAQLKALRNWQAEIQQRTAAFANAHPDAAKLTDDDRAELGELQKAQQEIASLFETLRESLTPKPELP